MRESITWRRLPPSLRGTPWEPHSRSLFDRDSSLVRVEGGNALPVQIVSIFLEDVPEMLSEIRVAVASRDGNALARSRLDVWQTVNDWVVAALATVPR